MPIAHLRITKARCNRGVLLGFDDEPAAIAVVAQDTKQRVEIHAAVTGHREGTVDDGFEKAPVAVRRNAYDRRAHVLAVHVADTAHVAGERRNGIAAGEGHMTAVEQQADFLAGAGHQFVHVIG